MKILKFSFLLLFVISCSAAPSLSKKGGKDGATPSTGGGDLPGSDTIDATGVSGDSLDLVANEGSSMSFLDSKALTVVYSRVFSQKAFGYMHCSSSKPIDLWTCNDIFAPAERSTLGTFDIYNASLNRGEQNINRVNSVSLNYIRSLRAGLSRECGSLVTTELANLKAGNVANNLLVKADLPTAASIEAFFRRILDIKDHPEVAVDIDASGYAADFPKSLALFTDKTKASYNAYLNLCISVAMDPQVFLY